MLWSDEDKVVVVVVGDNDAFVFWLSLIILVVLGKFVSQPATESLGWGRGRLNVSDWSTAARLHSASVHVDKRRSHSGVVGLLRWHSSGIKQLSGATPVIQWLTVANLARILQGGVNKGRALGRVHSCPSPLPTLDNIWVMVIVWRLRGNIIRTALCWIVWHSVHSQQYTYVSSSYRSNRLG